MTAELRFTLDTPKAFDAYEHAVKQIARFGLTIAGRDYESDGTEILVERTGQVGVIKLKDEP